MKDLIQKLIKIAGKENVITKDMPAYHAYTFGDATLYRSNPDIVVYPADASQIQEIVKAAADHGTHIVTGSGLTGLSGGAIAHGGILLNPLRMREVLSVDTISKKVTAQPGITCALCGAKRPEQIRETGGSGQEPLTDPQLAAIDRALADRGTPASDVPV